MSLYPIGAQPINFDTSPLAVACMDTEAPLLIGPDDELLFQIGLGCCDDTEYIDEPTFASGWVTAGRWTVGGGLASSTDGVDLASIEFEGFNPVALSLYCIAIHFDAIQGEGVVVTLGGVAFTVANTGLFTATVIAQNTDRLNIALAGPSSAVVISSAQVSAAPTGISIELYECETGDTLFDASISADPEYFEVVGSALKVRVPMVDTGISTGCFRLRMVFTCGEEVQTISATTVLKVITECTDTLKLRVCNDGEQMGVAPGYFEARLESSMVRPRWTVRVDEHRTSTGRIVRTFADRQTIWEMHVERVGYAHHQFISSLSLWDHLYIQGIEWSVIPSDYAPDYGDGTTVGSAVVELRPKQELLRAVKCSVEGEGCDPANDPVCQPLNATIGGPTISGGQPHVTLIIFDELGFTPGTIAWSLGGVAQTPVTYIGPGEYLLGPVLQGGVVDVSIPDLNLDGCSYDVQFIQPCVNSLTFEMREAAAPLDNSIIFYTNTAFAAPSGWAQVRTPDGALVNFGGGGLNVEYNPADEGAYCFWPSYGVILQPNTQFLKLEFEGPDFLSIDLTAIAAHQLTRLGFTLTPNLSTVVFAPFPPSLIFLDVTGITLTQTQINNIVIEMDALGTNNVVINADGAGNPALTGAAIAAAAAIVSRGGTVNSN